ncbi:MAG: hypothetical protein KBC00_04650 [Candidatus Levybacteria bacterium]|nr:hypothetical protein [Candidatus Levybacteria bacterium]MBP9815433.1 hypothetical protein [Candidatus Levybacteria bacterium]
MLYILHGDDTVLLHKRLLELFDLKGAIIFAADKVKGQEILEEISKKDLFLEKKVVIIEKILKLPKKDLELLEQELLKALDNPLLSVVLCHDTELSKLFLGKFKKAKQESFLIPKLFFTFLDNLLPKNAASEVGLLSQMKNIEAEQVFYALVKRIRLLLLLKSNLESEELVKMSSWQSSKLYAQSRHWTVEGLTRLYEKLFLIDVKMKSGGLMIPLRKHLDILLIQELN